MYSIYFVTKVTVQICDVNLTRGDSGKFQNLKFQFPHRFYTEPYIDLFQLPTYRTIPLLYNNKYVTL